MADPTTAAPAAEPTPTPTAEPEPPKPEPVLGPDGQPWDPDRAARTIQQQREAEKAAKEEAEALRAKLREYEEKELSEQEKLQRQLEEAQAKAEAAEAEKAAARRTLERANLLAELAKPEYGIVNATAAAKLIDGVEFDDDGTPANLGQPDQEDSLIAKFLKANDFLRGRAKPPAPRIDAQPTGERHEVNLTAEELEAAKKAGMTPEQYEARKNARTFEDWQRIRAQERAAQQQ